MLVRQLLSNWIIARPIDPATTTRGGLHIPLKAQQNAPYLFADVLHVGSGAYNSQGVLQPMTIKVGDVVALPKARGEAMPLGDDVVTLIRENEVVFIADPANVPRASETLVGLDGNPIPLDPKSSALPDSVYANRDAHAQAVYGGWIAKNDPDWTDKFKPGDGPDPK
jgi:co-chaperonin GroES (HSP10)